MTKEHEEEAPAPEGEEDLDQALDALDLETDFLSESHEEEDKKEEEEGEEVGIDGPRSSTSLQAPRSSKTVTSVDASEKLAESTTPEAPTTAAREMHEEQEEEEDSWKDRLEIYSRHFKPNPKEREKLEVIAKKLDVKSMLKGGANLIDNILGKGEDETDPHHTQSQWNRLVCGKGTKQTEKLPVSIILDQGQVLYKEKDGSGKPVAHHGAEMILFTRGFLIAKRETKSAFGVFGKKEEWLSPLGSALWTDVRQIQTTDSQTILLRCGSKNPKDQIQFEILPAKNPVKWRTDLQIAAIRAHQNFVTESHDELGWQYRLCHMPWFTEAVTGTRQSEQEEGHEITTADSAAKSLDVLDEYNGMAPLHYATRANHSEIMRILLQAGANPNLEDKEGRTPMYFAEYYDLPPATIHLLEEFGATKSAKAEEEKRGELFGKVKETENYREEKRAEAAAKKAQEEAEAVQNQMANNINAMQKRGERIEELGDKANDLETGAQDYADMAAQLKEKMKKKSKWGF